MRIFEPLVIGWIVFRRFCLAVLNWTLDGLIRRAFLFSSLAISIVFSVTIIFLCFASPLFLGNSENRWQEFQQASDRSLGISMYDSEERYLGIIHSETESDHLGEFNATQLSKVGLSPDHKVIPIEDAPEYFWRCLVYLEDRYRGVWYRNPFGVDAVSTAKIPISGSGGSTIEMQLARSIWKQHNQNSNRYKRKWNEWRAAPLLNKYLTGADNEETIRVWAAQHIPLIRGAGGEQDIYGVEASSQFLFGKRSRELSPAEQLLLVAAFAKPIRWRKDIESRRRTIGALIGSPEQRGRALLCASKDAKLRDGTLVIEDNEIRLDTVKHLAEMLSLNTLVPVDESLKPALKELMEHKAGPRLDPMRIGKALAPNVQREVVAELVDSFSEFNKTDKNSHLFRGKLHEVGLTVDAAKNHSFRNAIRSQLFSFSENKAYKLKLRDQAFPRRVQTAESSNVRAGDTPVLVVVANEEGQIVRYYNSANDSIYTGRSTQRPYLRGIGNSQYKLSLETRSIASIGKVGAALLLHESGVNDPNEMVVNSCLPGIKQRCWERSAPNAPYKMSYKSAFGQSYNAAIIRSLNRKVSDEKISNFSEELNLHLAQAHKNTPLATNLTIGRYAARPKQVHHLIGLAFAAAEGRAQNIVEPHFVKYYKPYEAESEIKVGHEKLVTSRRVLDSSKYAVVSDKEFLKSVLSEPVCDKNRGTLKRLSKWCYKTNSNVNFHIAKTGTASASNSGTIPFNEVDWWIAGGIRFADNRAYTYVVSVGSGSYDKAFAKNLGSGTLTPFVNLLLEDLLLDETNAVEEVNNDVE